MSTFIVMASSISSSTCFHLPLSSSTRTKVAIYSYFSATSLSKSSPFHSSTPFPLLGFSVFSSWNGLKHLGISIAPKLKFERKRRCKNRTVYASLFGVGAPEALVIGVVALLVFGPKGLAEVARNLGKTLRAFQPTIKELQEVSREFKSTLEREIGLDDIPSSKQSFDPYRTNTSIPSSTVGTEDSKVVADPNDVSSPTSAYTTEECLKITEKQLKAASAAQQQRESKSPSEIQSEARDHYEASVKETAAETPSTQQSGNGNIKTG